MLRLADQKRPIAWELMRLVSRRYRGYYAQRDLPDWQRIAIRRTLYLPNSKALYVINAKAASSSMTEMMKALGSKAGVAAGVPHSLLKGLPHHWPALLAATADPAVYKFTLVRHPTSRAVSSFFNLFVDRRNGFEWRHAPYMARTGLRFGDPSAENFDRFLAYVADAQAESELFCDVHLRLQTHNISARHVSYNRIGRIESLAADLDAIIAESGLASLFEPAMVRRENKSSARHEDFVLTAGQRRRIGELYAEDFERFGYEP